MQKTANRPNIEVPLGLTISESGFSQQRAFITEEFKVLQKSAI